MERVGGCIMIKWDGPTADKIPKTNTKYKKKRQDYMASSISGE